MIFFFFTKTPTFYLGDTIMKILNCLIVLPVDLMLSYILESGLQAEEEGQSLLQQMQQTQVQEERANKGIA